MKIMQRINVAAVALVMSSIGAVSCGLVAHAESKSSSPPPTLTGEQLSSQSGEAAWYCNNDKSGNFTYIATGTATGPYPGPFSESGKFTVNSVGEVTDFSANFKIDSPQGTVTGSKTITSGPTSGICDSQPFESTVNATAIAKYQAVIATPNGNYTDSGTSNVTSNATTPLYVLPLLQETYKSSQTEPTLIVPTSKDECNDDGWKNYPQFKNQGQCVSYVETHK